MRSPAAAVRRAGVIVACCLALSTPLVAAKSKRLSGAADTIVVRPAERTVTLDVKDAEARDILKSMQKQCGIKNLVVDPQVGRDLRGTFLFNDVPCRTAFSVVLKSLGLGSVTYSSSLTTVGTKPR